MEDKADHKLFRLYWGFILENLAEELNVYPSERVKLQLHKEFKEYLGYKHTSGMTDDQYRLFLYEVLATCASELGIYVRSNKDQPDDIQSMDLKDAWRYL